MSEFKACPDYGGRKNDSCGTCNARSWDEINSGHAEQGGRSGRNRRRMLAGCSGYVGVSFVPSLLCAHWSSPELPAKRINNRIDPGPSPDGCSSCTDTCRLDDSLKLRYLDDLRLDAV